MKLTILLFALLTLPLAARPVTISWDPNSPADLVTSYQVEIYTLSNPLWRVIASTTDDIITTAPDPAAIVEIGNFPDEKTWLRVFATNSVGQSPPSDILEVDLTPAAPQGLRIHIKRPPAYDAPPPGAAPKTSKVDIDVNSPGSAIILESSTGGPWKTVSEGSGYHVATFSGERGFFRVRE